MASSLRILIVEDDASVRRSIGRLLRASGFECAEHESAEALLGWVDLDAWDCLVSDINLPGQSGFELMENVRNARAAMPVVLVTAYDEARTRDRALQHHHVAYLAKPFEGSALVDAIRQVTLV